MSKLRASAPSPRPTRQALLAAEHGPLAGARAAAPLRVALVFPNEYHVGMSSLGFQIAHQALHALPGAAPERFFLDTLDEGSLESGAPLGDFDLVAFSAAYELDGPNILAILERAGLPLRARDRAPQLGHPIVLLGGVLAALNRRPLYPFIDLFAHGEAEAILPAFIDRLAEVLDNRLGRAETLQALGELPGIGVTGGALLAAGLDAPETPPPAPQWISAPQLETRHFSSAILTPHTEFADMALVDLARGCRNRCTFCWIGQNSPPYRVRPADDILAAIRDLEPYTDRFGLVASAVGAHPEIDAICEEMMRRGLKVSYSSLRVEEVTPAMLRALAAGGQKSATIAPEAGSPRLRRLLGKRLSDAQIFDAAEQIFGLGMESLKLYFMIGAPTETDEEALEIAAFVEKLREIMLRWARPRGRIGSIGINLGIYVPKPGLPLGRLEQAPFETVKARLKQVVRRLERIPNTHLAASSPDQAFAQGVLSMGGVEAAEYLLLAHRHKGAWRAANREWRRQMD